MSKQLLILGNGFDLHCGLKSSYKDFFRYAILDTIGEHFNLAQMKAGVSGFWEGLLMEYYKAFGNLDSSWCDIEAMIKDTLYFIYCGDDKESIGVSNGFWLKALNSAIYRRNPSDELKNIESPITRYLFMYCFNFLYILHPRIPNFSKLKLLMRNLLQELHNLEKRFCKYIKDCIYDEKNNINEPYIINAANLLAYITEFTTPDFENINDIMEIKEEYDEEEISHNVYHPIVRENQVLSKKFNKLRYTNILSFNYTAIFDILGVDSPCTYSNVHGKLCNKQCTEDCVSSSVIFGIDDTLIQSQDANSMLRLFSKTYRKMSDTSLPISILPKNDGQPIEIKFYGHSLSEADYSYFQSIFDFYNLYDNINVSLLFYYSKEYEQNDAIYCLINSYGKTLENKDRGKNLIHKLLLENRLKIVEVPDNI